MNDFIPVKFEDECIKGGFNKGHVNSQLSRYLKLGLKRGEAKCFGDLLEDAIKITEHISDESLRYVFRGAYVFGYTFERYYHKEKWKREFYLGMSYVTMNLTQGILTVPFDFVSSISRIDCRRDHIRYRWSDSFAGAMAQARIVDTFDFFKGKSYFVDLVSDVEDQCDLFVEFPEKKYDLLIQVKCAYWTEFKVVRVTPGNAERYQCKKLFEFSKTCSKRKIIPVFINIGRELLYDKCTTVLPERLENVIQGFLAELDGLK